MNKLLLALFVITVSPFGFAQATPAVSTGAEGLISISSKGQDVRGVLHDLFTQSKRNFVMEGDQRRELYLSLTGVEFEEALQIVCKTAKLTFEVQNGIFFITPSKPPKAIVNPGDKAALTMPKDPAPTAEPAPKKMGKVKNAELQKHLTTRMKTTDIREVFSEFSKQTGVPLEIDKSVPAYKVDAFLINTSLKYALDMITRAAGLEYRLTDSYSIQVYKPEENRVTVIKGDR